MNPVEDPGRVAPQHDEAVPPAEPTATTIRVHRASGNLLEVPLSNVEANKLQFNRDLKRCLANNDRGESKRNSDLTICWIRLIHMDTGLEIPDEDHITWEWLEQGSLQYLVADVMSCAFCDPPPSDSLVFYYADLDQLLDPKQFIPFAYQICKKRGQAFCERVLVAWKSTLLALQHEPTDFLERYILLLHPEKMLLRRCLDLLDCLDDSCDIIRQENREVSQDEFFDKRFPGDPFEDLLHRTVASGTIQLVKEKLDVDAVEGAFNCGWDSSKDRLKNQLWKLVQGQVCCVGRALFISGDLRFGLGAELMMALIQKNVPRWCWEGIWGSGGETLLQRIMAPIAPDCRSRHEDGDEAKAQLCIFLAERFSLDELCHVAQNGRNALAQAGYLRTSMGRPWHHVYDVIKEQLEARVRGFRGSLLRLVELARSMRSGLGGHVDALDSLPAFEEQMWHRAAAVRQEWLRMGWTFAADTEDGQISQVLNWHIDAMGRGIWYFR